MRDLFPDHLEPPVGRVGPPQVGTWLWDLERDQVVWSRALYELLGYDPDRDQATVEAFFAAVHPADRERVRAASAQGSASGEGRAIGFRLAALRDGRQREVVMDGVALHDEAGGLRGFAGIVLELTERLAIERELRRRSWLLAEAQRIAHVGSWTWDPESGIVDWSAELYRICGVRAGTVPSPDLFRDLIHPEDRARVEAVAARVAASGLPEPHEHRIVRPDGELRHLLTNARAVHDEDGRATFIGTSVDVTERKELEARLTQAQKMEAMGRLAGGIAHDFNNLLTIVQGFVGLLRLRSPSEELDHIGAAAEAGARLTRQLLAFSRRALVEPRRLDLNAIVRDSAALVERTLGEDIEVRLALDAELWPVRADAGQMQQILLNLAVNARDAMPAGGVLTLATSNTTAVDGEWVELRVSDDGVGMDAATQAQIFEPFFTTKPRGRGTGLGLATVFGIVAAAGGKITVESRPEAGATFRLAFPRDLGVESATVERSRAEPAAARSRTLLVVEDDAEIAAMLARFLEGRGYRVLHVTRPAQALQLWGTACTEVSLVICDLVLPGMNGRQLVERLRETRPALPVLFVSGYPDEATEPTAGLGPGAAFLSKPFALAELEVRIADLLAAAE
jgi:PAS domain S-box-containing protein